MPDNKNRPQENQPSAHPSTKLRRLLNVSDESSTEYFLAETVLWFINELLCFYHIKSLAELVELYQRDLREKGKMKSITVRAGVNSTPALFMCTLLYSFLGK